MDIELLGSQPSRAEIAWPTANFEVAFPGQNLAWITLKSYPGTTAELGTVQHKGR